MRAIIITILTIVLFYIIVVGTINLVKRSKERDKVVEESAEKETLDTSIAAGIKPINVDKILLDLTAVTNAKKRVHQLNK